MKVHWILCGTLVAVNAHEPAPAVERDLLGPPLERKDVTLPSCGAQCISSLATASGCELPNTQCLCTSANPAEPFAECVAANCTVIESLVTQRYKTISCDEPIRDQGRVTRVTWCILFAISTIAIALRFAARAPWLNGPGYGWDDYTMLVVLAFAVAHESGLEIMIQNGMGQDLFMLTPSQITKCLRYFWYGEICYTNVVMWTKVSILFLYLRIFTNAGAGSRWFRWSCFFLIGACIAGTIGMVIAIVFECDPISGAYERWNGIHPTTCINMEAQVIAMGGINIALDLIVFFLPIPEVIQLHTSNKQKLGICITFLVGLFVTIISIVRLVKVIPNISTTNPTWDLNPIAIWSHVEVNIGVLCACMPCFAGAIKRFWKAVVQTTITSKIGSRLSSRKRDRTEEDPAGELRYLPSQGVSKTVDTSVVFNKRVDSSDEAELVTKSSNASLESGYSRPKYTEGWRIKKPTNP